MKGKNDREVKLCKQEAALCAEDVKGQSLPIYKTLVHDAHNKVYYIFVGTNKSCESILKRFQDTDSEVELSAREKASLEKLYGKRYLKLLGLDKPVYRIYIYQYIHRDDTIFNIKRKLAGVLKSKSPGDIYLWISTPFDDDVGPYWDSLLTPMFKDKPFITGKYLKTLYQNLCGKSVLEVNDDKTLSQHEAVEALKSGKAGHVNIPLGFKYTFNNQYVFFPVNPLQYEQRIDADQYDIQWELQQHIESFVIPSNTINVFVRPKSGHELYFPTMTKRYTDVNKDDSQEDELESLLACYSGETNERDRVAGLEDCMISSIHLRNDAMVYIDLSMNKVFNSYVPIEGECPVIKYISKDTSIIKCSKSITNAFKKEKDLVSWSNKDKHRVFDGSDGVVFRVYLRKEHYADLTISNRGMCDVKISYGIDGASVGTIKSDIRTVNAIIKSVNETIPILDDSIFKVKPIETTTKIINMLIVSSLKTVDPTLSIEDVQRRFLQYGSIFSTLSGNKNAVRLIFKRTNGFASDDQISEYVKKYSPNERQSSSVLANKLVSIFGLQNNIASDYVSQWTSLNQQFRMRLGLGSNKYNGQSRFVPFTKVQLIPTVNGYKIGIEGLTNPVYYRRIIQFIYCVLKSTPKPKKKAAKSDVVHEIINDDDAMLNEDDEELNNRMMEQFQQLHNDHQDEKENMDEDVAADEDSESEDDNADNIPQKKAYDKHVLMELHKADPALFKFKSDKTIKRRNYAETCQKSALRQPVVLTKTELDALDKKTYNGVINYGSTEELAARNHYICPEVWCPKSRVAMTLLDHKKKKAKCPKGEEPIVFDHSYWVKDGVNKNHYIGYLKPDVHPKGMCLPCCFKSDQFKSGKQRDDCHTKETKGNERYIKSFSTSVETGRYGLLPPPLSSFFDNQKCGTRPDGTGQMHPDTKCYLRSGGALKPQSFLYIMSQILNNSAIQSEASIIKAITQNLTIELFMGLYNGQLLKKFLDNIDVRSVYDPVAFARFRTWFVQNPDYTKRFGLSYLTEDILGVLEFGKRTMKFAKHYMREFMIYSAYRKFIEYLEDDELIKTHEFLLELFNHQLDWLNIRGHNIILFEYDGDHVYLPCDTNMMSRPSKPCIFILKNFNQYELLHYVSINQTTNKIDAKVKFVEEDSADILQKVSNVLHSGCAYDLNVDHSQNVLDALYQTLKVADFKTLRQVISYDFRMVGFWIKSMTLFIPLKFPSRLLHDVKSKIVYVDTIYHSSFSLSASVIGKLLEKMNKYLSDDEKYTIRKNHTHHIELVSNAKQPIYIPLDNNVDGQILNFNELDLDMLVQWQENDQRIDYTTETLLRDKFYKALWNEVIKVTNRDKNFRDTIAFCRHPTNPIPMSIKQNMIMEELNNAFVRRRKDDNAGGSENEKVVGLESIVGISLQDQKDPSKFHNRDCSSIGKVNQCIGQCKWFMIDSHSKKKISDPNLKLNNIKLDGGKCMLSINRTSYDIVLSKLLYNLLNKSVPLMKVVISDTKSELFENIVILTDADIKNGKLKALYSESQNKDSWGFSIADVSADKQMLAAIPKLKKTHASIIVPNSFKGVKTDLKKYFKNFEVNENEEYDNMWLFKLFRIIHDRTNRRGNKAFESDARLRDAITDKMIADYQEALTQYEHDSEDADADALFSKLSFNPLLEAEIVKESNNQWRYPSVAEFKTIVHRETYYPSDYEVMLLSMMTDVNVFVISRKTTKTPDGIWCLGKHEKPVCTIILQHKFDRKKKCHHYELIVKNQKQYMFEDDDFEKETWQNLIVNKCKVHTFDIADIIAEPDEENTEVVVVKPRKTKRAEEEVVVVKPKPRKTKKAEEEVVVVKPKPRKTKKSGEEMVVVKPKKRSTKK